jgi:hypothetical protein
VAKALDNADTRIRDTAMEMFFYSCWEMIFHRDLMYRKNKNRFQTGERVGGIFKPHGALRAIRLQVEAQDQLKS